MFSVTDNKIEVEDDDFFCHFAVIKDQKEK